MFIHFDLFCNGEVQEKLHRAFRHKVAEWGQSGLVSRTVLTYHIRIRPSDSLYVCLDIPRLEEPTQPQRQLSQETINKIPPEIMQHFDQICQENKIKMQICNYRVECEERKKSEEQAGRIYNEGASVCEVIRFASVGTKIALEVLDRLEKDETSWRENQDLSDFVFSRLDQEFGKGYKYRCSALHFVCNPLRICDSDLKTPKAGVALAKIKAVLARTKNMQ